MRSRLLAEADRQVSNPFLLCVLISKRTRQFMMAGDVNTGTAQLVNLALGEVIAGTLEFDRGTGRRGFLGEGSTADGTESELESPTALAVPAVVSGEAPCEDASR